MISIFLHGFGSSADCFRRQWLAAGRIVGPDEIFLDGPEPEPLSGRRRWFAFTGRAQRLRAAVESGAPLLEEAIAARLADRREPAGPQLRLIGHSQGGMLALELVMRGRLDVAVAECYGAFIPLTPESTGVRRDSITTVTLYSSSGDRYVSRQQMSSTIDTLRRIRGVQVRHRIATGLRHDFSGSWLEESAFAEELSHVSI